MLQQEQSQAFEGRSRSLKINDTHALVEDGQYSAHEVVGVGESLNLLPFGLTFGLTGTSENGLVVLFLVFNTCLGSVDFFITLGLSLLDHLDEVVHLHDGAGRVHLDNVHVDKLIVRNLLARNNIAAVNATVFSEVSVVIEEDLLGVVVGLVNHHQFASTRLKVGSFPAVVVFLNDHGAGFLQGLENSLEYFERVVDNGGFLFVDES